MFDPVEQSFLGFCIMSWSPLISSAAALCPDSPHGCSPRGGRVTKAGVRGQQVINNNNNKNKMLLTGPGGPAQSQGVMVEKWPAADPHPDSGQCQCRSEHGSSNLMFQSSVEGGLLVSSTVLTPGLEDAGAALECRVTTPGLPEVREHTWRLPVQCE